MKKCVESPDIYIELKKLIVAVKNGNLILERFFLSHFQIEDVVELHKAICPSAEESPAAILSLDGVQECKSNSVSLDVFSIKMPNCRHMYPLKIKRPQNKFRVHYKPHLQEIILTMYEAGCILHCFVGDNPKRSEIREALCHSSLYACEYCTSKAERYTERNMKLNEEKKKTNSKSNNVNNKSMPYGILLALLRL